jgi:hypothetical protein
MALNLLSAAAEWSFNFDRAASQLEEGLSILESLSPSGEVEFMRALLASNLADQHLWRGRLAEAVELTEIALDHFQRSDHVWGISKALEQLAVAAAMGGDSAQAARLYDDVLTIRLSSGYLAEASQAIMGIAGLQAAAGQPERAARLFAAASEMRAAFGVRYLLHFVRVEQILAEVRGMLEPAMFSAAWEAGCRLQPDEAIAEARTMVTELTGAAPASGER